MKMKTVPPCLRLVILGAPQVGKSALAVRFLTRRFIGEYSSGKDQIYQTMFKYEDCALKVDILDCASNTSPEKIKELEADAVVVVYNVADRKSLKQAQDILDVVSARTHFSVPVLLLGNKTDLHHLRQVTRPDVVLMTHQYRCRHREVSVAESYPAVNAAMQELLLEGLEGKRMRQAALKRRPKGSGLLGSVSRRLGNVFRRKSLEDLVARKPKIAKSAGKEHAAGRGDSRPKAWLANQTRSSRASSSSLAGRMQLEVSARRGNSSSPTGVTVASRTHSSQSLCPHPDITLLLLLSFSASRDSRPAPCSFADTCYSFYPLL